MNIDFNTQILGKLLVQNNDKVEDINKRFPKIDKWKQKEENPTFRQLANLANYFNIPFGYFFLGEVPDKVYPIPHFRSIQGDPFKPSNELQSTIEILKARQDWAKDIKIDAGAEPLYFANTISTQTNIRFAAKKIREILNVPTDWAQSASTWEEAFRMLIVQTEKAGIYVVVNGVVNNSPNKKLDINEFRGFVLFDEYAPFIFINGNDFNTGKIFTIIHEIAHILLGVSASFDLSKLMSSNDPTEKYCDQVTAEFLVPTNLLLETIKSTGNNYERLSHIFKVSRLVIARRLIDLNIITKKEFFERYNEFKILRTEKVVQTKPGGNFYNTAPYRISREFFNLVYSNVKQNRVLYRDAFRLTGLTPKSFDGYIQNVLHKK